MLSRPVFWQTTTIVKWIRKQTPASASQHITLMHPRSLKLSVVIKTAVGIVAISSPVLASPSGGADADSPTLSQVVQPGQSRSVPDVPTMTPTSPSGSQRLVPTPAIAQATALSVFDDAWETGEAIDADESDGVLQTVLLERRWNNLCDGCEPSTGAKSFPGASKSLSTCRTRYPNAKKTILTKQKKKVFTTQGCKTTTTRKVKQTMVSILAAY